MAFNGGWTYPGAEYIWQRIEEHAFSDHRQGTQQNISPASQCGIIVIGARHYNQPSPLLPFSEPVKDLVLDCTAMSEIDFTVVQVCKC